MKGLLAALLVASLAFAGCAGKTDGTSSTAPTSKTVTSATSASTTTAAGTTSGTTSETTSSSSSTSQAPTGQASDGQSHTVSFTSDLRNGTAPLNVTFSLDGTGKDAQTTWSVDFGDGNTTTGTTLPASIPHTYLVTGTLIAKASVLFGDAKMVNATTSIAVLAPSALGAATLYNQTFTATVPIPNPYGGLGDIVSCGWDASADKAGACYDYQLKALYDNGANKTFFVGYKVNVPAGAVSFLAEGGSKAVQTCQQTPDVPEVGSVAACVPDFDMVVFDPTGAPTSIGTSTDYEVGSFPDPAPGVWTVIVVYFAGPPNADATAHFVVA